MKKFAIKTMQLRSKWCFCLLPILGILPLQNAQAHGYVIGARGAECQAGGQNKNCGPVAFEPQSTEAIACKLVDGHIASAGLTRFYQLDEQSPNRWYTRNYSVGKNKFLWKFTALHKTTKFTASITKADWRPSNAPQVSDFGPETVLKEMHGTLPVKDELLEVTYDIPSSSSGPNLILLKWYVEDTGHCFVSVVDANVVNDGVGPGPDVPDSQWRDIGALQASQDLLAQSRVRARFFTNNGEDVKREISMAILNDGDGKKTVWPYMLAEKVNRQMVGSVQLGKRDEQDVVTPMHDGANHIYIANHSDIVQVVVTPEPFVAPQPPAIQIMDLLSEYTLEDETRPYAIEFKVLAQHSAMSVTAIAYQDGISEAGSTKPLEIASGASKLIPLVLLKPVFGSYTMVVRATDASGHPVGQESKDFQLKKKGAATRYEYRYPDGVGTYKAGTVVLAADGRLYKAKPFPYLGWANQNNAAYKPGTGSDWEQAWEPM